MFVGCFHIYKPPSFAWCALFHTKVPPQKFDLTPRGVYLHGGRGAAFAPAEAELFSMFKAHRTRGRRVNERWLCIQMRKLIRLHYGDEAADNFKGSYGWLERFASRFDIALRRANNSKNQSVAERLPKIKRWHARLRRRLKVGPPGRLHVKWGRWLPKNRLSVDQERARPAPVAHQSRVANDEF